MKVFEISKEKGFGIDNLALTERPEPKPGRGQIVLKLRAASLNYRDLMMVKGLYNPRMALPRIPFSDGAGDVVAVGDGVSRVKVGDRVAAIFMQTWLEGEPTVAKGRSALGGTIDGLASEYALLNEEGVVHLPEHLSYEEAAALPCAGVTAWNALITQGGLKAGDTVLVQGTGGVSVFGLQFAAMTGARVIVISSSNEKLVRARGLGPAELINYKETPDWDKQARQLTGGNGVDHIIEVGGAGTLNRSLNAVRIGGCISLIGALAGGSGEISTVQILMKGVRVQGIFVGSRDMFEAMNRAIEVSKLNPVVDRVFDFSETREALEFMESGAHFGKICVRY
jgi:NADPH:quinone reductase-like Zn-dependent oxidoreductase